MRPFIIADNQDLTKSGFLYLINKKGLTDRSVKSVEDKRRLIDALLLNPNAVVILDYSLFDFGSFSEILSLKSRFPNSSWMFVAEDYVYSFIHSVEINFASVCMVFKDETMSILYEALLSAQKGNRYLSERVIQISASENKSPIQENKLTQTEIEIVKLIAGGLTTKEIAGIRFLSVHTIMSHRKNIFRKLEVNNVHEMTRYAARAGWIDLSDYYI